jgi:hypothetical protein
VRLPGYYPSSPINLPKAYYLKKHLATEEPDFPYDKSGQNKSNIRYTWVNRFSKKIRFYPTLIRINPWQMPFL